MKSPVIAIGLDSADPLLLEKWMSQGHLKNLSQLRQQGIYGRLNNIVNYDGVPTETSSTEKVWVMFLTSCLPNQTGYWASVNFDAGSYEIAHGNEVNTSYDNKKYPPFYSLTDNYRVAVLDVPYTQLSDRVNGVQILGWGGHFPHTPSHSQPPELFADLIQKYGKNPVLHEDYKYWWDRAYFKRIQKDLKTSIATRSAICRDLLQREPWDLFLTVFGDTHTASHDFWHMSQPDHPLYPYLSRNGDGSDPMLNAFEDVDKAIGEILAEVPDHAHVLLFSVHGMGNNGNDMFTMLFLPELLYRFNFPGKSAIAPGKLGVTPPPLITKITRNTWAGEIWQRKYESNPIKRFLKPWTPSKFLRSGKQPDLVSPYELHEQSAPLNWMPTVWYSPLWPQMRAFALPAFADGAIRINLQGREREGIVATSEYDALCDQLTRILYGLKDARTGEPVVKEVVRTRHATKNDANLPDADLIVLWRENPTDVIDSPELGRIGPVPYYRTGGHRSNGFLMAKGPGIAPGSTLPEGQAVDLGPTILELMGAPIPNYVDGKPLLKVPVSNLTV